VGSIFNSVLYKLHEISLITIT